ncbi:MAG: SIMPL domain-containing protein [Asticcacaulis sp.]|nr:SIMPL domain-containing protein [Asticcacaulis sp.]
MKTILGLAVAAAMVLPLAVSAQTGPATPYDKAPWWMKDGVITQTGYVYTEVPANRAGFSATFLAVDDSIDKAQAKAVANARVLQQALAKLGKDKVRVSTDFTVRTLYEQYRDSSGTKVEDQRGDKINGYEASLTLKIEVRDVGLLEKAYALVLAASPTSASDISFSLQASNEDNSWLYNEAVKDARQRAGDATAAAGATLGKIKVIDPNSRACATDVVARNAYGYNQPRARKVEYYKPVADLPAPVAPATANTAPPGTVEYLEGEAARNPFIQTPPLQRLETKVCAVYGLN